MSGKRDESKPSIIEQVVQCYQNLSEFGDLLALEKTGCLEIIAARSLLNADSNQLVAASASVTKSIQDNAGFIESVSGFNNFGAAYEIPKEYVESSWPELAVTIGRKLSIAEVGLLACPFIGTVAARYRDKVKAQLIKLVITGDLDFSGRFPAGVIDYDGLANASTQQLEGLVIDYAALVALIKAGLLAEDYQFLAERWLEFCKVTLSNEKSYKQKLSKGETPKIKSELKHETKERYAYWCKRIEALWLTHRYRYHKDVCKALAVELNGEVGTDHLVKETREFFNQLKNKTKNEQKREK